ncbi:hypothetical protein Ancab_026597 [Ancistrocladus abbreviatus]
MEFVKDEQLRVLPKCEHWFHADCIDQWLFRSLNCPTCRDCVIDVKDVNPQRSFGAGEPI